MSAAKLEAIPARHLGIDDRETVGSRLPDCARRRASNPAARARRLVNASPRPWRNIAQPCGGWWRCRPPPASCVRPADRCPGPAHLALGLDRASAARRRIRCPRPTSLVTGRFATHQRDQPPGDRRAQAGAAVFPGHRGIGLGELFEDARQLIRRDADAGVPDGEADHGLPIRRCPRRRRHHDLALLGELEGVANEIAEDLPQPGRVAEDQLGNVGGDVGQPARCGRSRARDPEQAGRGLQQVAEVKGDGLECQRARPRSSRGRGCR